ncbi:hypothetical protein D3C73_1566580 [compost metagenome]
MPGSSEMTGQFPGSLGDIKVHGGSKRFQPRCVQQYQGRGCGQVFQEFRAGSTYQQAGRTERQQFANVIGLG